MMLYQLMVVILSGLITHITRRFTSNFSESIPCEISVGNKIGYIAVVYHFPSQTASEFPNFWKILKNFCTKFSSLDHPL